MMQLACITVKFQKCGKDNCRCSNGHLHGPYFWLIIYKRPGSSSKGKYNWIYLGKKGSNMINKLKTLTLTKKWNNNQWNSLNDKIKKIESKNNDYEKLVIDLSK